VSTGSGFPASTPVNDELEHAAAVETAATINEVRTKLRMKGER
jgi:hypothetical protein